MSISEKLQHALALQKAGQLDEAAPLYREVLTLYPTHPDALYLLGLIALQKGQAAEAEPLLRRAIAANNRNPSFHFHFGVASELLGRLDMASAAYRHSLELRPDDADTLNNLGNVLSQLDKPKEAEAAYRDAIAQRPGFAAALSNLGNLLREKQDFREALVCYREAVAAAPDNPVLHNSLGLVLWALGERNDALAFYTKALELDPNHADAMANLGVALQAHGDLAEAEALFNRALALRPSEPVLEQKLEQVREARRKQDVPVMSRFTLPAPHDRHSVPTGLFIGGKWQDAKASTEVINPSTGKPVTRVADGDEADAIAAVDAAETARTGWAAMPPRRRAEILRKCFDKIAGAVDWLAFLISLEMGKSLADAKAEVLYAAEFYRWYSEEAARVLGENTLAPAGANRILVEYQPIGISLLITPWNFPAAMATRKIAPALAAGCPVILKPAIETPLTALAIAELMAEAGVPDGVMNIVTTTKSAEISNAILHDPRVRKLSFTGSTEVGRTLLKEAADQILSCSMELGGNAPFIVCDDASLKDALDGAMLAKMRNGGEACTAANRFYVQRGLYKSFTDGLVERMGKLKLGEGTDPETTLGPMITPKAVNKIAELVDDAVAKGGKLLLGGTRLNRPGSYYPATVIADVPDNARVWKEEIFGPVAVIQPFDSDDEAIKKANDTELGLSSYLYTGDLKRGLAMAGRIEAGMVGLNRGLVSDPAAPFGGVKQSGLGREGSHHGLMEFTECKYVAVSW